MSSLHSGAATLPKGFRLESDGPRTPEPSAPGEDAHLPSAPRPRLKLKRRNVSSHLQAPTQQFLASVAAADVPIPSVEEPDFTHADEEMVDGLPEIRLPDYDELDDYSRLHVRTFSPPKTPAPELAPSLPMSKFPNWTLDSSWDGSDIESSPEYESSRPSTAFSTQTSSSLFSRFSHPSEDGEGDCLSPGMDSHDFSFSDLRPQNLDLGHRKPRRAPWTKAMSAHLWSTYTLYLQDPKVTPVRLGKSCIPPEGVCNRVAREAKRSWKGSKQTSRSGSTTPTAESSKPYMEWPHTCAATRAHLRELCRLKATSQQSRSSYMSQSPTPFNKAVHRRWNRRSTPARSPSIFSAQDMAMSLTLSTSEAMQPQGPLAQLTSSEPSSLEEFSNLGDQSPDSNLLEEGPVIGRARLGSPFAKSYGPSSSSSLAESINIRRQSQTVGPRKLLKSPARLTRSRSGTQKRRSVKGIDDQPRKRPSLAAALWGSPESTAGPSSGLFSSTASSQQDKMLIPRTAASDPFLTDNILPQDINDLTASASSSRPARLGSPFSSSQSSYSFPNRLSQPINFNLSALRRPFATVQQIPESNTEAASPRSSLASRLAYIDQRLKELRNRSTRRRSQSPL
ncbi:hypothetical protein JX266_008222 [Neoarthrinium moseri]|uniref:uncharacterized protein n=1 Tax=Neoarthrinium moseri TaxID=1658444 RepID=UPI001FDCF52E|nr:uncharacterized protein JN550_006242 [Neoarthrinium moseri]KAI1845611.1 hypothetical protein JX266_008222 [Neoarthrinium moseri]KAI1868667.1 hypothetical protein JN550_006242 [Neoarthrinium moseri]